MLNLPEALLLFALHDDRGTVHSPAFLAIDHGLRGAALAELRLKGLVRTRKGGLIRHISGVRGVVGHSVLREVQYALEEARSPGRIVDWLGRLERELPSLRTNLIEHLHTAGILVRADQERLLLPDSETHPMVDGTAEHDMLQQVAEAARQGAPLSPRMGTLIALISACHLTDVLFEDDDAIAGAEAVAEWVLERDGIAAAVHQCVARSEGTWQG